jgi:hypothetical protein
MNPMHGPARTWAIAVLAIGLASLATPVAAHVVKQVGPYSVAIGWVREPPYVGQLNAVQVVIKDGTGNPVGDLSADALKVVVSAGGQQSDPMSLAPTFDEDTGLGIPGDYEAPMIPTAPGDYTFHVTGSIHATKIDETATSSDTTFDPVVDPSAVQFPSKLPAVGDMATRLERVDARVQAQLAAANDAKSSAQGALVVGLAVGGASVLIGLVAVTLAIMARRPRPT